VPGGVGFSWFELELTSDHVGAGGVGHSWFELELTSEHVGPEEPPEPQEGIRSGGAHTISMGGMPLVGEQERLRVSGRVETGQPLVPVRFTAAGIVSAQKVVTLVAEGSVGMMKDVRLSFSAERDRAECWSNQLREEDELLLLI
jgi:hypothetical protein